MDFLPMPHHVRRLEGRFCIRYNGCIMLQDTEPSALLYARMLRDTIREETGLVLSIRRGQGEAGDIVLRPDQALAEKAYRVHVLPEGVTVSGGSDEALLNGVMTLCQWVQRHGVQLPALEIEDAPDLAARAYYLDCSRGRVPTLATLKRYADILCRYKINQWQLYIEHTYLFRHLSEAWRDDTPLTAEEILELDAYCRARHIELVPSLSSFGHMYKILSTKTCCELCELTDSEKKTFNYTYSGDHHTLRSDDARALAFITGLIDEYAALFTSRKFNICCDETFDLGKGRSAALVQEQGEHEVYIRHVAALCGHLVKRGITPMFWGDIVYRHPETYARLPKETICLNWGYLPNQREDEIRTLAEMGATQYACPGVCTWNRWLPLMENSYKNIRVMCRHGQKYHAIGMLNTDWGDYGHICHPWLSVPGILYGAAFSWNAQEIPFDEINRAISFLEYGDRSETWVSALAQLTDHEVWDWFHTVRWIEEGDAARQAEILADAHVERVPTENAAIAAALERLDEAAAQLRPDQRQLLQAVHTAADGASIFNEIGLYLSQEPSPEQGDALAVRLENWLYAFLQLWRGVSKETTVRRVQRVVTDYANVLRGRELPRNLHP